MELCLKLWPEGPPKQHEKWPVGDLGDFAKAVKTLALGSAPSGDCVSLPHGGTRVFLLLCAKNTFRHCGVKTRWHSVGL